MSPVINWRSVGELLLVTWRWGHSTVRDRPAVTLAAALGPASFSQLA